MFNEQWQRAKKAAAVRKALEGRLDSLDREGAGPAVLHRCRLARIRLQALHRLSGAATVAIALGHIDSAQRELQVARELLLASLPVEAALEVYQSCG